jgi:hypothetical protein
MEIPVSITQSFSFVLVFVGLVIAWFVQALAGGFRFGKFERQVEAAVDQAQVPSFLNKMYLRLSELGFAATELPGQYAQGAGSPDGLTFTHARTPKLLTITMDQSQPPQAIVRFSLKYVNSIVADTGEGAYRDAVLDYLTGQKDSMVLVPNRSYAAVCTLVGGVIGWLTLAAMFSLKMNYLPTVIPLGLTYFVIGTISIIILASKRGEVTGMPLAISGTVMSFLLLVTAVILKVATLVH